MGMGNNTSFVCQVWGDTKRAFLGSTLLVLIGLFIMTLSVFAIHDVSGAFEGAATPSGTGKIEYYLPYPGILPDNPLYKVKAGRDKIMLWLTWDPLKKADRQVLYADKRIGAAKYLFEGGKVTLAVSTATKAEKYLGSAFSIVDRVSSEGKDVKSRLLVLAKAMAKHQEILEEISAKAEGTDRNVIEETLKMNKLLQQNLQQTWAEAK